MLKQKYMLPFHRVNLILRTIAFPGLFVLVFISQAVASKNYIIDENSSYFVYGETWQTPVEGRDTKFILSTRTKPLRFKLINGSAEKPVVIINSRGQVKFDDPETWGAITFENCSFIKISGNGHPNYKYGFTLSAQKCGLAFSELSTDCEAEYIKIDHPGFYGIFVKKNFGGNPPSPIPVFSNLIFHDYLIENIAKGMCLSETATPGMEFKHVKIYNNIVRITGRESIQIANMVEDVEIYNNTLLNAGLDDEQYQNNLLQIGDNSVANVYNNIIIGAPKAGIISMGMGNNIFTNNYIGSCKGMFIDNRKISNENYPIVISGNYFVNNKFDEIIKNMNEINTIVVNNNSYNTNSYFFLNGSGTEANLIFANNSKKEMDTITFVSPANINYALAEATPEMYKNMGAPGGEEFFDVVEVISETDFPSRQILLSPDMLVEEVIVPGGEAFIRHLWKQFKTNNSTRYIRLSMNESVNAAVNELIIYGYKESLNRIITKDIENTVLTTSIRQAEISAGSVILEKNPVTNSLQLILPQELQNNFNLGIFDMKGNQIYSKIYTGFLQNNLSVDLSDLEMKNGIYILRCTGTDGKSSSVKFNKYSNL